MKRWLPVSVALFLPLLLASQIVNIEEQRITGTNDSTHWYGHLRLGANLNKVQQTVLQLNAASQVEYKRGKTLLLLLLDARFLRAGGQEFNNAGFAHLRYNRKLTDPLSMEVFTQAQYNRLLLIELRALAGCGLRFRVIKSRDGKQRIYLGAAYMLEQNRFTDATPDRTWHRLSGYLSFTFRPWPGVLLNSTTYFQPKVTYWPNHRIATECRLETQLGKKLSFFSDFSYQADNALPADAPVSNYNWMNGITWRL